MYKNKQKLKHQLQWNGLIIPVNIRGKDIFAQEALETSLIKYCRIIKKAFKHGPRYFVQLVIDGIPPAKRVHGKTNQGALKHSVSPNERIGLDIGTSTLAICSEHIVNLLELAPLSRQYDTEILNLQRKLDRSRRATNPLNFNADGTIKRGVKLKWVRSKSYMRALFKLKNLHRLKTVYIKESHSKLANEVLSLGNDIYVEDMNFKALQARAKNTTINARTGRCNRKHRFGKSLNYKAPARFLSILDTKLKYIDKRLRKANTKSFRASQYNHVDDNFVKKTLGERWNMISNKLVQRDLYSAFLLMNSNKELTAPDRVLCIKTYPTFIKNHETCIEALKQNRDIRVLSSFGVKRKNA